MSKREALRKLKHRRMQAGAGYTAHLLDIWFAGGDIPGVRTAVTRLNRKAGHHRQAVRP